MAPAPILSHMAPLKKILFIGRIGLDTGYDACVELAKLLKLKLTVITDKPNAHDFITRTDYVFVSGYLTIIEAALSRKLIFAGYNNPVRQDILIMHPISRYMIIGSTSSELAKTFLSLSPAGVADMIESAHAWAKDQTWDRLAAQYETLWQK